MFCHKKKHFTGFLYAVSAASAVFHTLFGSDTHNIIVLLISREYNSREIIRTALGGNDDVGTPRARSTDGGDSPRATAWIHNTRTLYVARALRHDVPDDRFSVSRMCENRVLKKIKAPLIFFFPHQSISGFRIPFGNLQISPLYSYFVFFSFYIVVFCF